MKAVAIGDFGGRDVLEIMELPIPEIGDNELLIKVKAASVNPVDWKIREGRLKHIVPHIFPLVLGRDCAGIVERTGKRVTDFKAGDHVFTYCNKPQLHWGTQAEFAAVSEEQVALKPSNLSFQEAASVPVAALTAYQALFEHAGVKKGETVLIHAAAGGVGGFAVQLAKRAGAYVIGTVRSVNHSYVIGLGADEVIDYTGIDFAEAVLADHPGGVDAVIDIIAGKNLFKSAKTVKKDGSFIALEGSPEVESLQSMTPAPHAMFVLPRGKILGDIAAMLEAEELKTSIAKIFPLEDVSSAHEAVETGHTRGKIVLTV